LSYCTNDVRRTSARDAPTMTWMHEGIALKQAMIDLI